MRDKTRNHIILTASDLFYQKGYNLTGINEIIEKAGIAKATLYNHFRSKEDLCLAYLDARDQELLEQLNQYCEQKKKGIARVIGILEFLIQFFESGEFNGCWCIRTSAEIPRENERIKLKIKQNKKEFLEFIEDLIKKNISNLTRSKRERLAKQVYLLYEGAVTESHLQKEDWPIHENIRILKTLLK